MKDKNKSLEVLTFYSYFDSMKVNDKGELENIVGSSLKLGIMPENLKKSEDILKYLHQKVFEKNLSDFVSATVYFILVDKKTLNEILSKSEKEEMENAKLQLFKECLMIPDMVKVWGHFELCKFDNFDF